MAAYSKISGIPHSDVTLISGAPITGIGEFNGVDAPPNNVISPAEWDTSLWTDSNLTSNLGTWTGDSTNSSERELKDGSYHRTPVLFIDSSGATKELKLLYVADHGAGTSKKWVGVAMGIRVQVNGGTHPDICVMTSNGIAFDQNGDLVDGDHLMRFQFRTDAKVDTYHSVSVVMSCSSNVITIADRWYGSSSSTPDYWSAAQVLASPTFHWLTLTYTPATRTWARSSVSGEYKLPYWWLDDQIANPITDRYTSPNSAGTGIESRMDTYYIDSDTGEHRMWYFTSA